MIIAHTFVPSFKFGIAAMILSIPMLFVLFTYIVKRNKITVIKRKDVLFIVSIIVSAISLIFIAFKLLAEMIIEYDFVTLILIRHIIIAVVYFYFTSKLLHVYLSDKIIDDKERKNLSNKFTLLFFAINIPAYVMSIFIFYSQNWVDAL